MEKMQKKWIAFVSILMIGVTLMSCSKQTVTTQLPYPDPSSAEHSQSELPTSSDPSVFPTETPSEAQSFTPSSTPTPTPTPSTTPTPTPAFNPLEFYNYSYTFVNDLSSYEEYMNPVGEDYLFMVNADNRLSKDFVPKDLTEVVNTRTDRSPVKMTYIAAKALEALYIEADACGMLYKNKDQLPSGYYDYYILSVTSAYRSYATQYSMYEGKIAEKMEEGMTREEAEAAVTTTAKPGASEHQTGLCADMHNFRTASSTNGMREAFAESEAGKWLVENCYKFGFILRYPEDKTEITGIGYESWHFRYVGRFHATRMHELGYCLEQYVEYLEEYGYTNTLPTA